MALSNSDSKKTYLVVLRRQGREYVIGRYETELEQVVACGAARNAITLSGGEAVVTCERVGQ